MVIIKRNYNHYMDFGRVKAFLAKTFIQKHSFQLLIPTRFENAVFFDTNRSQNVQIWFDSKNSKHKNDTRIVGIVILDRPTDFILITHPNYKPLLTEMILWAEHVLTLKKNKKEIHFTTFSPEKDSEQNAILTKLGYIKKHVSEHNRIRLPTMPLPDNPIPEGFHIKPIYEEEYDQYVKAVEIVFNHDKFTHDIFTAMRQASFYHDELLLGAFTNDGILAAFCCVRIDENRIAEFEPVGTLPRYRNKGLAKSLMNEGFNRAKKYRPQVFNLGGAPTEAADRLYESIGFSDSTLIYTWIK